MVVLLEHARVAHWVVLMVENKVERKVEPTADWWAVSTDNLKEWIKAVWKDVHWAANWVGM
jgi:hypothetical protein